MRADTGKRDRTASAGVAASRTSMSRPIASAMIWTCSVTVNTSSPVRTYSLPWWSSWASSQRPPSVAARAVWSGLTVATKGVAGMSALR
jgi:hypothetical protein